MGGRDGHYVSDRFVGLRRPTQNNPVNAVYFNGLNTPTVNSTISAL